MFNKVKKKFLNRYELFLKYKFQKIKQILIFNLLNFYQKTHYEKYKKISTDFNLNNIKF